MSVFGDRVVRVEDPKLLTDGGTYVADLRIPELDGAVHVTYVRSTIAHAGITVDRGRRGPRARPAWSACSPPPTSTCADLPPDSPMFNAAMTRPFLARDKVRFVGEPIAVILSERPEQGADAAELVWADYDPLPAVVDPAAAATDEVLRPRGGRHQRGRRPRLRAHRRPLRRLRGRRHAGGRQPAGGRGARSSRRAAAAAWVDGRLVQWSSTQHAHGVRDALARVYGLDKRRRSASSPPTSAAASAPRSAATRRSCSSAGSPGRWAGRCAGPRPAARTWSASATGGPSTRRSRSAAGATARVEAYRLTVLQDAGAYAEVGSILPYLTRMMAQGTYDIPKVEFNSRSVTTNTTPTVAYRGAGPPGGHRRHRAGHGPVRGRDRHGPDRGAAAQPDPAPTPSRSPGQTGTTYDSATTSAPSTSPSSTPATTSCEPSRRAAARPATWCSSASACRSTSRSPPGPTAGKEFAKVEVEADGSATVYTGSSPHGQGHHTAFAIARQRRARHPDGPDPRRPRRHRPRRRGRGHHGLAVAAARRLGRAQGVGRPGREGQAGRRRRARGQPRRRRARQGHRPVPRRRHARPSAARGPSWPTAATATGDPARR